MIMIAVALLLAAHAPPTGKLPARESWEEFRFEDHGDVWSCRISQVDSDSSDVAILQNKKEVYGIHLPRKDVGNTHLNSKRCFFPVGFPVIAVGEHTGCGHGERIDFFGVIKGKLINLGSPYEFIKAEAASEIGGPVFRDYDKDGKPEWIFDDWNYYTDGGRGPKHYLILKLANNKLTLFKTINAPKRKNLPYLGLF